MKKYILLIIFTLSACEDSKKKVEIPSGSEWDLEGWKLVWNDEFSNSKINLDKWSHEIGGHGWGNNELQYYSDKDSTAFIKEGKRESIHIWLIITKMGTIEGWDNFRGNPKLLTAEVEKRIRRLFPNIKK